MIVFIGADHAGFDLKNRLAAQLRKEGHTVNDLGSYTAERCDYPDIAQAVGAAVVKASGSLGILVCGSGVGMSIASNKLVGVRAAHASDPYTARMARAHNDANVLCIGSRVLGEDLALDVVYNFMNTVFEQGRHATRVTKISNLERGH